MPFNLLDLNLTPIKINLTKVNFDFGYLTDSTAKRNVNCFRVLVVGEKKFLVAVPRISSIPEWIAIRLSCTFSTSLYVKFEN